MEVGNYDSVIIYSDDLINLAEKNNSNRYVIKALCNKAKSFSELNKPKEAYDLYYRALKLCVDTSSLKDKAHIYSDLGNINFTQGNYATAKNNYNSEIQIRRSLGDLNKLASNLINLSALHRRLKEYDSSWMVLEEAKIILNKIKDKKLYGYYYNALGAHYSSLNKMDTLLKKPGYLDSANNNYERSLNIWLKLNDREEALRPLFNMGYIYQLKKDYKKALGNYLQAKDIVEALNLDREKITVYGNLAELYYDLGD